MVHTETGAYRTAFRGLVIYRYFFSNNVNLDHILKVNFDILMNNIYTKNAISLN